MSLFADRNSQSIRIEILRDACAEDRFRFLDAGNIMLDHPAMECIEVGNTEAGAAPAGMKLLGVFLIRIGLLSSVQRNCRTIGCEFCPPGRLELERQSEHVAIE